MQTRDRAGSILLFAEGTVSLLEMCNALHLHTVFITGKEKSDAVEENASGLCTM